MPQPVSLLAVVLRRLVCRCTRPCPGWLDLRCRPAGRRLARRLALDRSALDLTGGKPAFRRFIVRGLSSIRGRFDGCIALYGGARRSPLREPSRPA